MTPTPERAPEAPWPTPPTPLAAPRAGVVVHGRGVARIPTLPALLDDCVLLPPGRAAEARAVLGWGFKPSADRAAAFAAAHRLPLWRAEDGFLRSIAPGAAHAPWSVVLDDLGLYYAADAPSRLEQLIGSPPGPDGLRRAARLTQAWRDARVSKYNHAREARPAAVPDAAAPVLVIDQTFGDASITHGAADAARFGQMLQAALDEHPRRPVWLKVHPDVVAGAKRGHFAVGASGRLTEGEASRVTVIATDAHPPALLEHAAAVYTVTSQMGFEALLWGRPVRCFGLPFYAGWGLTGDALPPPARRAAGATLEALVHAALVAYPRYVHPESGQRCEVEHLLAWMALQRRQRERFPAQVQAIGFSRWKKPIVRAFFAGSTVQFASRRAAVPDGAAVALWGRAPLPAGGRPAQVLRLEDGFLRSVGLGADLVRPLSWVIDRRGLYYDAGAESDLEHRLQHGAFDDALRERARALHAALVATGITKYNVGGGDWRRPAGATEVVLVVGQVESDAAVALGAPGLRTNLALLQAARQMHPAAHLIYKPHPDVVARLRRAGQGESDVARWCDEIVVDAPMAAMLRAVDVVHVISSLAGFEALLRGRRVVVHGAPFYAGWGLTQDTHPLPRRSRRLTLDELVAGVLIDYPTYVSRTTGHFTTPERALEELRQWRETEGPTRASPLRQVWRAVVRQARVLGGGPA